jgi:hypothetical protein
MICHCSDGYSENIRIGVAMRKYPDRLGGESILIRNTGNLDIFGGLGV